MPVLELSIHKLLRGAAGLRPEAPALLSPGRRPATWQHLLGQVEETIGALNGAGIGCGDRVAVVLPNGPEMAACFLGVTAGAVCAPLNPVYRANEFDFYFSDLKPKALIVQAGLDSPATAVAASHGIRVIRLAPRVDEEAGLFTLEGLPAHAGSNAAFAEPDDIALVLHTSGTTSRPKIVPLSHANLCHSAHNIMGTLRLTPEDLCLNVMPLFHIHGLVGAVLASVAAGARVVCSPGFLAPRFFDWMEEFAPTWYTAVPTMHQAILARAAEHRAILAGARLRFIRSSSAPLPPQVMAEMERAFGVPVIESYGMTEASHQMASNPLPPKKRKPGSVGVAAGPEIAIMDEDDRLLEAGQTGEIVIRGPNVTGGYESNPAANQAAFTKDWFRTGDQGRLDSEGYLFLTGRLKEIINRGGEKIQPREIEEVLMDHPAVGQALAFAFPDPRLGEDIAAAVVLAGDGRATELALREFAASRLADFKVPARIVILEELPKGPTGKLQRIGLAAKLGLEGPAIAAPAEAAPFVLPRSPLEEALAATWRDVLDLKRVGIHDNFFELGGDSVLATQVISRVRDATGKDLPLLRLFETPTVAELAAWLDAEGAAATSPDLPPRPSPAEGDLPLSHLQEQMWLVAQHEEASAVCNRPAVFRLRGPVNARALEAALTAIVARHAVLRTTYHTRDGVPRQVVSSPGPVALPEVDLSDLAEPERTARARELAMADVRRPFDLTKDLMLRGLLVRLGADECSLILTMHHIASDGWSTRVFLRELASHLSGNLAALPELAVQYPDFAMWQREQLQSEPLQEQLRHWRDRLAGSPAVLNLPFDRPRPPRQTFQGSRETVVLPAALSGALKELSRREGVTLFMTLLAAFQVLLSRYSGQTDICVGTPVSGRTRLEFENLIGFFANTLVLRADLSDKPAFRQLLSRVREDALGAFAHQDLAFGKLVESLNPERSPSYPPLFQVMLQLRNLPVRAAELPGLEMEEEEFDPGVARFDMDLDIRELAGGLKCVLTCNTDLFDPSTARRILGHYGNLLEAAVADPDCPVSRLPILSEAERHQLLIEWNSARSDIPHACIHALFEQQAARQPSSVAAVVEGRAIAYAELDRSANRLAHQLLSLGVGLEAVVGICAERSLEMLVGMLGILKAGGAYLPLDPAYPKDRLRFMLEDAGARVLLVQDTCAPDLSAEGLRVVELDTAGEGFPDSAPPCAAGPNNLAYIMYTSGSAGKPKGVQITHRNVVGLLHSFQPFDLPGGRRAGTCVGSFSFDLSVEEIFGCLCFGGTVHLLRPEHSTDAGFFVRYVREHGINVSYIVPDMLEPVAREFARSPGPLPLRCLITGLAPKKPGALQAFRDLSPSLRIWNAYGPTEVTYGPTAYEFRNAADRDRDVPIGRPFPNYRVYVVDGELQPVPLGVVGELLIGGVGVARGYLHEPALTAEKFIPDPFSGEPGARLYRSGDLARYLPDGNLEFQGRADAQVKLRGYRIELGEIESVLRQHAAVEQTVVVAKPSPAGDTRLVAYVQVRDGRQVSVAELRGFLRERLPEYMAPSVFQFIERLPKMVSGKVDAGALPEPDWRHIERDNALRAPRDAFETRLARVWERILGVESLGLDDNFFDVGGHSLLAVALVAAVEKEFRRCLSPASLLAAPTLGQMADLLRGADSPQPWCALVPMQPQGSRPPLFCVHANGGDVLFYRELALRLGKDQPFYGLQSLGLDGREEPLRSVEEMAERYLGEVRGVQPEGPYSLGGYCLGAYVALEMARRLEAQGERVALVAAFATSGSWRSARNVREGLDGHYRILSGLSFHGKLEYIAERMRFRWTRMKSTAARLASKCLLAAGRPVPSVFRRLRVQELNYRANLNYSAQSYGGPVAYFRALGDFRGEPGPFWGEVAKGGLEVHAVPGTAEEIFREPDVTVLAEQLRSRLETARAGP
jgi:amino acid adenylation domain-containing protein